MLINKITRIKNFPWYCLFASSIISTIHLNRICFANTQKNEEIKYVLPRDAIPAIKNPEFVPSTKAELDDRESVIGVTIHGESRAYSVYLLNHHEIVNDTIGDNAIAVTWCPLANLAVVYDRKIDGKEYTFGVSGKLLKNTLVMFDYETESLWPIVYGKAINGELSGKKLHRVLNYQKVPWGIWRKLHPDTVVLSYRGLRTVGSDVYKNYHESNKTGIYPVENRDERLRAKENVIGIEVNDKHKAYPLSLFDNKKTVTDTFQGLNILIYKNKETSSTMVYDRMVNGNIIDFEDNPSQEFVTDNITRTTWDLENGIGIKGPMKGLLLQRVNFITVYWFVWADYYPKTDIYP
ncbi:MAG: DUF3179 domain-containing protein [Candidatus Brocadiaceae bacterium]|nr:DUF3179 domain-containing protein [Candidatus Brocadiaceae bacterium]